jgi:hypothetical protein
VTDPLHPQVSVTGPGGTFIPLRAETDEDGQTRYVSDPMIVTPEITRMFMTGTFPDDIETGLDQRGGRRTDDGKQVPVWVSLTVLGDPYLALTPNEARSLAARLLRLAMDADQITSSAPPEGS